MLFVDCHTHTEYSADSQTKLIKAVSAAKEKGLTAFAVTDHCETEQDMRQDVEAPILNAVREAEAISVATGYKILRGIELGETIWDPVTANRIIGHYPYDEIIASVHVVWFQNKRYSLARTDFGSMPKQEIREFLRLYFNDLLKTAQHTDYDILAHLTVPLRYSNGKYGCGIETDSYMPIIEQILRTLIERNRALEVNTSGLNLSVGLMPDLDILKKYYEMGGRLITLGSDAHKPENMGLGFEETAGKLKKIGFRTIYCYENRKAVSLGDI